MKKVIIEFNEGGSFNVIVEDRTATEVTYDEMLGLISAVTMPETRPCLQWLKTKEQEEGWKNYLKGLNK